MPLPTGIQLVTVNIGPPTDYLGALIDGATVTFTPSTSLVHVASGTPLFARPIQITLDTNGIGQVSLPATDQNGFTDGNGGQVKNWTYKVQWSFKDRTVQAPAAYNIQLPGGAPVVDLDLLVNVLATSGVSVALPSVLSVNGQTGAVQISGQGGGAMVIVLGLNEPVPAGTPAGTVIVRKSA